MGEGIPHVNAWSVPCCDETSDDNNYQLGFRAQSHYGTREPGLAHPDITRGCQERLSRRDWYEAPARPAPAPLPRQEEFWRSTTTCCGLGACQTISPGALGSSVGLPR